jgi:arginase family enzyme
VDVFEPGEVHPFMPEPGGLAIDEAEQLLGQVCARSTILGAGITGVAAEPANVEPLTRLAHSLGL